MRYARKLSSSEDVAEGARGMGVERKRRKDDERGNMAAAATTRVEKSDLTVRSSCEFDPHVLGQGRRSFSTSNTRASIEHGK
jgi:hypothetical protein